ncbi:conserved hypothetical protein [Gammaproteobacteria bacterium]
MEHKAVDVYTKEIQDRTVTGIAAVIGNVDSGFDRIWKGAFKKTIKEGASRVRHLWMHDYMQPPTAKILELKDVGKDDLPASVLERAPEAMGGLMVVREYLRTSRGDEILEGVKTGAINEMSFAYDAVKYDFEEIENDEGRGILVRNLREVRLFDTSDVNWGMNEATVASKNGKGGMHLAPYLEGYKEMLGERYEILVKLADLTGSVIVPDALKAGRVLSGANLEKLKNALAVLEEILLAAEPSVDEEAEKAQTRALTEAVLRKLRMYEADPILVG